MNRYILLSLFSLPATVLFADPAIKLGPMLGHVGPKEAHIWIQANEACELGLQINGERFAGVQLVEGHAFMGRVAGQGLQPATEYTYTVLLNGVPAPGGPHGRFRTAPEKGQPTRQRIAFSSCYGRTGDASNAGRIQLAKTENLDLMLELGDNHYADSTDPQVQRPAYASQRNTEGWKASVANLPTYAIWDDHDYGPNDSDRTAAGKENSLACFKQHWANPSYGEAENPGIYTTFHRGDIQVFLLDDRYYRDPNRAPATPEKTVLGERQKAWLKEQLAASEARLKIIALGSEWHLHGHSDSYTSFKAEQKEILDCFKDIEGVLLVSGDRHFSGAYQVRGETIEVTAGPMGSKNYPSRNLPDMFINHGKGKLFAVFDLDTTVTPPKVVLEIHRAGEGVIETREITWDEVNGRKRIAPLPPPEKKAN